MLGRFGRIIGTREIRITMPVFHVDEYPIFGSCPDWQDLDIQDPFSETFLDVERAMLTSLAEVWDDDDARVIVHTYDYLSTFAVSTNCFYMNASAEFTAKAAEYRRLSDSWTEALR